MIGSWQALRAGVGVGFVPDDLAATVAQVVRVLPSLEIPSLPLWLVVHREIRSSKRIRAVFVAREIPKLL